MKNLRRLGAFLKYVAIVTFVVAVFVLIEYCGGEMYVFLSTDELKVGMYILFMIPVIFASMAVSLRFIAKAIDPDYQSEKRKRHEPPMVLPPE